MYIKQWLRAVSPSLSAKRWGGGGGGDGCNNTALKLKG